MNKKCFGCGAFLQSDKADEIGFVSEIENDLCNRCFRIKHYNEYQKVVKTNEEFTKNLHSINETRDLVLLVVDLFNIPKELDFICQKLQNDVILVLTKRDIFAKDIYDKKFLDYFEGKFLDKIIISSEKNLNFDSLMSLIYKHKKGKNVYVVGFTNAGKSTMINKMIYNYSNSDFQITTSPLTSTTIDSIEIKLNEELVFIDTPGILEQGDMVDILPSKIIKKIVPNKTIRPKTFQFKKNEAVNVDDLIYINVLNDNNLTFFMANSLNIKKHFKKNDKQFEYSHRLFVKSDEDIVIKGLGFIKSTKKGSVIVNTDYEVDIYTRKSLI